MNVVRLVFSELIGLFIDDGSLALFSLILVAAVAGLVKFARLPPLWGGVLLLIGCIAILMESILRAARKQRA